MSALTERLNVDRTNVSRLCARMQSLGEVDRKPCSEDKRAVVVRLTRKGRAAAAQVNAASSRHFEDVVDRLGAPFKDVLNALETVTEALQSNGAHA